MVIVMKPGTKDSDVREVVKVLEKVGLGVHISKGVDRTLSVLLVIRGC